MPITLTYAATPTKHGGKFHAHLGEEQLTSNPSRTPIFHACRVLAARGSHGQLQWKHKGRDYISGHVDIATGAKLAVEESNTVSIKFIPYVPFTAHETPQKA